MNSWFNYSLVFLLVTGITHFIVILCYAAVLLAPLLTDHVVFNLLGNIIDLDVVNVKGPDWFSWFRLCEELDSFFQSNMNLS